MVFSSNIFLIIFLPVTFVVNLIAGRRFSNIWLLFASLFFYAWGEPVFVLVMIASIIINWAIGMLIEKSAGGARKAALALGVACDLAILGYYKYAAFFANIINEICHNEIIPIVQVTLPIGISFFTFQAISYIADVYRKETDASPRLINVALYISFFPQLIAGPIVKYRDINRQIENRLVSADKVAAGFKRFIYGLSKKVLISNVLGFCADSVYMYDVSYLDGKAAWIGALAYTFQIYYDFSGYSDMAIGLGKMFGFDILENFNYPYLSASIAEFWRRWHISLGSWFREYVYIPLGGNRKGYVRTYINLAVVFLLTGLWHGAALSFIAWGCYHGFFIVIERLGLKKYLDRSRMISTIYCFTVVNFGWVLFRAPSLTMGIRYMIRMIMPQNAPEYHIALGNYLDIKTIFVGGCAILGAGALKALVPERIAAKWRDSLPEAVYCVILLVICMASLASDTYNPFIYFQF